MVRPGKYIEYDFPIHQVSRLVAKERRTRKDLLNVARWWNPRPSCLWRTLFLATLVSWEDWQRLEPEASSQDVTQPETTPPTPGVEAGILDKLQRPPSAWERLYYRLDEEADQIVRHTMRDKRILDPFAGGGTSIVEGMRLGADVTGVTSNPVAWFYVKKETEPISRTRLEAAYAQVEAALAREITPYYQTLCPGCGQQADVKYTFWMRLARCLQPTCGAQVPLFNSFVLNHIRGRRRVKAFFDSTSGMPFAKGPGQDIHILVCPECSIVYASQEVLPENGSHCPTCGSWTSFEDIRTGYLVDDQYRCPTCGSYGDVLEAVQRQGQLPYRMTALEAACPSCGWSGYKTPDEADLELFEQVRQRLRDEEARLNLPDQPIPPRLEDYIRHRVTEQGFQHWCDMFNQRQLLILARQREVLSQVEDDDAREFLLLAWIATTEYYNMMACHQAGSRWTHGAFSPRTFVPWSMSIEGNPWNAFTGAHTLPNEVQKISSRLDWILHPKDDLFLDGTKTIPVRVKDGLAPHRGRRSLICRSLEELDTVLPDDQPVDLAVFDPPTQGTSRVAYLSDFFYVWLRPALARDFPVAFSPPLIHKYDDLPFEEQLAGALSATSRRLADDGLLIFFLSQKNGSPWQVDMLERLLGAGLSIKALFPLRARPLPGHQDKNLVHTTYIGDPQGYDVLFVCARQSGASETIDWQTLADRVCTRARDCVAQLTQRVECGELCVEDVFIVALGQSLAEYTRLISPDRPAVTHLNQPLSVEQVISGDEDFGIPGLACLVDRQVETWQRQYWPGGLDTLTTFYLTTLLGQTRLPRQRFDWRLAHYPGLTLQTLKQHRLVRLSRGFVRPIPVSKRLAYLARTWDISLADARQPNLPGIDPSTDTGPVIIDLLHLAAGLTSQPDERAINGMDDPSLLELAQLVAGRLPRRHVDWQAYQDAAAVVTHHSG